MIIKNLLQFCDFGVLYRFINEIEEEATPSNFREKVSKIASLNLSIPMTVFLLQQFKSSTNLELFIELSMIILFFVFNYYILDGHLFVADQLKKCLILYDKNGPVDLASILLHQSLKKISNKIDEIDEFKNESNIFDASKNDAIINFAPYCKLMGLLIFFLIFIGSISSSSPGAQNLNLLLNIPQSNRRSRTPQFSYNFDTFQNWFDITLVLPYPIMLKEVIIKPHTYMLASNIKFLFFLLFLAIPSAIQIEVSSDEYNSTWTLLENYSVNFSMNPLGASALKYEHPVLAVS